MTGISMTKFIGCVNKKEADLLYAGPRHCIG
eukprot:CAMPEP_0178456276 /NCGR_PEP_ID=MMETSP0689_2-20121128/46380_1 /TAXON_ID=160604 /ORGANISM="Amphidinium massartii, Strain CS-259" /LENGTH=30 /DNA_ID= /DNA_START= /DNA_END= /DNA_ORIENTATION=